MQGDLAFVRLLDRGGREVEPGKVLEEDRREIDFPRRLTHRLSLFPREQGGDVLEVPLDQLCAGQQSFAARRDVGLPARQGGLRGFDRAIESRPPCRVAPCRSPPASPPLLPGEGQGEVPALQRLPADVMTNLFSPL